MDNFVSDLNSNRVNERAREIKSNRDRARQRNKTKSQKGDFFQYLEENKVTFEKFQKRLYAQSTKVCKEYSIAPQDHPEIESIRNTIEIYNELVRLLNWPSGNDKSKLSFGDIDKHINKHIDKYSTNSQENQVSVKTLLKSIATKGKLPLLDSADSAKKAYLGAGDLLKDLGDGDIQRTFAKTLEDKRKKAMEVATNFVHGPS